MSIHPSSAVDVNRLLGELRSADVFRRETAVARLAVIGPRAVTKLAAAAGDETAPVYARAAALQALEAIGAPRAAHVAFAILAGNDDALAVGAIGVLAQVARTDDALATRAFERLAALALAPDAPIERRLAALAAFDGSPHRVLDPIHKALSGDPSPRMVARVARTAAGPSTTVDAMVERGLPDDPAVGAAALRQAGDKTRVTVLRQLVDAIRERERLVGGEDRLRWMALRGQAHHSLATRASRLALYDLRETLEQAHGPLPVGFLAAAASIGDTACLEPLAAAWVAAPADDRWWRDHLAEAFHAIVSREGVRRRAPALRRILERWPGAGVLVAAAKR